MCIRDSYQNELLKCLKHFHIDVCLENLIPLAGGTTQHFDQIVNPLLENKVSRTKFDKYCQLHYQKYPVPYLDLLVPHIREVLEWIKQHGYTIAIASSSKKYEILKVLKDCHLEDYFSLIMSGDMFHESKPNPEIYLTCVKKLNLTVDECIAVEDSEYGITAAKNAHLTCIALEDLRFGYKQDLADYLVKDLINIIDILKEV